MSDRITIGAIVSSIHETCESAVWAGVTAAAAAEDVNLITFVATSQDRFDSLDKHFATVRDYALAGGLDGIILSAGFAAEFTGATFIEEYATSFGDIPMVTLSLEVPGCSCVMADNRSGIIDLMTHLVMNHGLSRLVFIKGPPGHPEAEERYRAYLEGLELNRLTFDETLVCPGKFSAASGRAAIQSLQSRGIGFDGVLAVDDETAFGAMDALKESGCHVPTEVAVAGFDDVSESAATLPPMTTVRQPLYGIGARAVTELLARIRRASGVSRVVLSTRPVFRRSCGCFADYINNSRPRVALHPETGRDDTVRRIAQLLNGVDEPTSFTPQAEAFHPLAHRIVDNFEEDICKYGVRSGFLDAVDTALFRLEKQPYCAEAMEAVLQELSAYPAFLFDDPILIANGHQLLQLAAILVHETGHNAAQLSVIQDSAYHLKVRETCQRIIRTFEIDRLLHTLATDLPELGIERFAVLIFNAGDEGISAENWHMPDETRLLLARSPDNGRLTTREAASPLPTNQIIPSELRGGDSACHTLFMPLFFRNEIMGYVLFGLNHALPPFIFEDLRLHMSIALKSALLKQSMEEQSLKDTLTGLFNRRGFMAGCMHAMETAARSGVQVMMAYVDLDRLKQVNDQFGHEAGDRAIRGAASILTSTFRRQDVIGRLGGDEFAVLCTMDSPRETEGSIARRLYRQTELYNYENRPPLPLSMTVGCVFCDPVMSLSVEDLIRKADMLMMSRKPRMMRVNNPDTQENSQ